MKHRKTGLFPTKKKKKNLSEEIQVTRLTVFLVSLLVVNKCQSSNRPFNRYGGHIELIRFKEYYRMPSGHEQILFVFLSAFRDIFSQSFLRIRL